MKIIAHLTIKENIMDDNLEQTILTDAATAAAESHKAPGRLDRLIANHPRFAKVLTLTGAATVAVVGVKATKNVHANRGQLSSARNHAGEAVGEVVSSVSSDTESA